MALGSNVEDQEIQKGINSRVESLRMGSYKNAFKGCHIKTHHLI